MSSPNDNSPITIDSITMKAIERPIQPSTIKDMAINNK